MPKTVVFRDNSHLDELVLGEKHVHYYSSGEKPSEPKSHADKDVEDVECEVINPYCRYLDLEAIQRIGIRKPEEVQEQLEKKSKEDARVFVSFLREQIKLKYMNFHRDKISVIFAHLHEDLPMMRNYNINNFYTYFRDEPL